MATPPHPTPTPLADTATVEFEVLGVEPVRGRGALIGLAVVEMNVDGVVFALQGVQIARTPSGGAECRAPVFRHPRTGTWLPAVLLPPELAAALAAELLSHANEVIA